LPIIVRDIPFGANPFNPDEEHMGSTTFGSVDPAMTGLAMPQNIKINRAGCRRVRKMVAPY
jgi:hypothetical protein